MNNCTYASPTNCTFCWVWVHYKPFFSIYRGIFKTSCHAEAACVLQTCRTTWSSAWPPAPSGPVQPCGGPLVCCTQQGLELRQLLCCPTLAPLVLSCRLCCVARYPTLCRHMHGDLHAFVTQIWRPADSALCASCGPHSAGNLHARWSRCTARCVAI